MEVHMAPVFEPYGPVFVWYLALGVLFLVQALVADVAGIRAGHVPGTAIAGGHDDFLFRATRAQANTNENLGVFLVLSLAAVLLGGGPWLTNALVGTFVASRLGHMLAYYLDLRPVRSAFFVLGVVCLAGLAVVGVAAAV
jgi:uncharacterized MAPEG superfamily protein